MPGHVDRRQRGRGGFRQARRASYFAKVPNSEKIVDPDRFELVRDILEECDRDPKHSGAIIFSGEIPCGCCDGCYGSKVWQSNDEYHRVILQSNAKFKDNTRCLTPHLTEDEIKSAFVR